MFRLALFMLLLALPAAAQTRAETEAAFRNWLEEVVWPRAADEGVGRQTFERATKSARIMWDLPGIVEPGTTRDAPVKQTQAEFRSPERYFRERVLADIAATGRRLASRHAETLARIEAQTGVPGRVLIAIWGRESGFGRVKIPHDAFSVLATIAFLGDRYPEWFTGEMVAAMKIVEQGLAPEEAIRSSWAGALGQPQFMPSSYLAYAADGDGDGRADIWGSDADSLASIASFLAQHGWQAGRDWGFEVRLPEDVPCHLEGPDLGRSIADWEAMGIARISGRPFPGHERDREAFLLLPAGTRGPAFLVTPNFYAIKAYNRSDLYALFIGHAGDRIEWNVTPFKGSWSPDPGLFRSDIARIQRGLEARGFDPGGADGLAGFKTRRSIGRWQETQSKPPTCWPDTGMKSFLE